MDWSLTGRRAAGCVPVSVVFLLLAAVCLAACRAQFPSPTAVPTRLGANPAPSATASITPASISPTITLLSTTTLTPIPTIDFPKIDRYPRPATIEDWVPWAGQTVTATLHYNPAAADFWQMDLRTQDLSQLDLRYALNDLLFASFDDRTRWPTENKMPFSFDPARILKLGLNPGLGVRELHERGITGEGIGVAIIDMPLLADHQEYAERLRLYEELYFSAEARQQPASMHGTAVASLAVGQTTGVAPGSDLYYIAVDLASGQDADGNYRYDFTRVAQAIRRILEINQQLPAERKIRVISLSFGWTAEFSGYAELSQAVAEARLQGLFVLCAYPALDQIYGFKSFGLERTPLADPDSYLSYSRSHYCDLYGTAQARCQGDRLLVPMGSRTAASPMGKDEYAFYRMGSESWTIPYLAGMYALVVQVDPGITPERFWEIALQTGRRLNITGTGGVYTLGVVLDPQGVVGYLGK